MIEIALFAVLVLVILLTLGVPLPYCFGAGLMVMYFAGDVVMKGNMLWGFQQLGQPGAASHSAVCSGRDDHVRIRHRGQPSEFRQHLHRPPAGRSGCGRHSVLCTDRSHLGFGPDWRCRDWSLLIPEMEKQGYPREYATALIANASLLGSADPAFGNNDRLWLGD